MLRRGAFLAVVIGLFLTSCGQATTTSEQRVPLGLGTLAVPGSGVLERWMPDTKVPWTYAWMNLLGGADTGDGWAEKPANGRLPLDFALETAKHSYTPVYTYFQVQFSRGGCKDCGGDQVALKNLNNPGLMRKIFADFRLLMKRLGSQTQDGIKGFGKLAIVNIEPNLSAYVQQAVIDNDRTCFGLCKHGEGNDPALFPTSVASSCDPELTDLPDTYVGFNQALLRIRDLYAPNVRLGFNVSAWATYTDINTDPKPGIDAVSLGKKVAEFAKLSGASTYDLLFNDITWGDAGYYKTQLKSNIWWDTLNQTPPGFQRWEEYVRTIVETTGKKVMLWQIPVGNQRFLTVNNTKGHFQDNRAEYFFAHLSELKQTGIVGILFGAQGLDGATWFYDAQKDGVTNPPSICNSDGLSSGEVCTKDRSTVSDDDGGYLRTTAEDYYKRPLILTGAAAAAVRPRTARPASPPSGGTPPATCA